MNNADGTEETQLADNEVEDQGPARSPDGTQIAFSTERDGTFEIYVMNADGTGRNGSPIYPAATFPPSGRTA